MSDALKGLSANEPEEDESSTEIEAGTSKLTAQAAGYMELDGAVKDGDCSIVYVPGGISKKKGCCNQFMARKGAEYFRCGQCKFED